MGILTDEDKRDIVYFHQEKGDITRLVSWEDIKPVVRKEYPELITAMNNVVIAQRTLDAIVHKLESEIIDETH